MDNLLDFKNSDLRTKLFAVLAITGCISNIAGFTANAILFGFTTQTLMCALCAVVIIKCIYVWFFQRKNVCCNVHNTAYTGIYRISVAVYFLRRKHNGVYVGCGNRNSNLYEIRS